MQLIERSREMVLDGRISSYNINTFRGRVYIEDEQRPIPFELADTARDENAIESVTASRAKMPSSIEIEKATFHFGALKITTNTGRLKGLIILSIE